MCDDFFMKDKFFTVLSVLILIAFVFAMYYAVNHNA